MRRRLLSILMMMLLICTLFTAFSFGASNTRTYKNVTYKVTYNSFKYDKKNKVTTIQTRIDWKWNKPWTPNKFDLPALTTSGNFSFVSGYGNVYYYPYVNKGPGISYKKVKYKDPKNQSIKVYTKSSGRLAYAKVYTHSLKKWNKKMYDAFAMEGYMIVNWRASGKVNCVGVSSRYGQSYISISPSVSRSGGSISFNKGIRAGAEAYLLAQR